MHSMCGRYSLTTPIDALRDLFQIDALPNLPPGVKAELLSLNSTGDGEITFDLSGLLPHKAHTTIKTSSAFSMMQGGKKQEMSLDADLEMTLEKKK